VELWLRDVDKEKDVNVSDQYGPSGWQPNNSQPQPQPYPAQPPSAWQQPAPTGWQPPAPTGWPPSGDAPTGPNPPVTHQQPASWSVPPAGPPTQQQPTGGTGRPKARTPLILTVVAVVVALLAGASVWWFAIRDTATAAAGQPTPQLAVSEMLNSLSDRDMLGVAEQLDPTEAALLKDMSTDVLTELKRLGIIEDSVDLEQFDGVTITTANLTFDESGEEQVNDHVTVVKLTGGTITFGVDAAQVPFTDKVKGLAPELQEMPTGTQTIDIAAELAKSGMQELRIATVMHDDTWYPSLFYTVADNAYQAAKKDNPSLPTPEETGSIAPIGADSPENAVDGLVDQAMAGNWEGVIGMLPPDEMGVLYDYGRVLLSAEQPDAPDLDGATFDATWQVDDISGGKKVSIKTLSVTADGETLQITRDVAANSVTVVAPGQAPITVSPDTIDTLIQQFGRDVQLDPQAIEIIKREFVQIISLGLTTVEVDGKWYVSPLRTYSNTLVALLQGLEPADIDYFISLAKK